MKQCRDTKLKTSGDSRLAAVSEPWMHNCWWMCMPMPLGSIVCTAWLCNAASHLGIWSSTARPFANPTSCCHNTFLRPAWMPCLLQPRRTWATSSKWQWNWAGKVCGPSQVVAQILAILAWQFLTTLQPSGILDWSAPQPSHTSGLRHSQVTTLPALVTIMWLGVAHAQRLHQE